MLAASSGAAGRISTEGTRAGIGVTMLSRGSSQRTGASARVARRYRAPMIGLSLQNERGSAVSERRVLGHGVGRPGHFGSGGSAAQALHSRRGRGDGRRGRDGGGRAGRNDRGGAGS